VTGEHLIAMSIGLVATGGFGITIWLLQRRLSDMAVDIKAQGAKQDAMMGKITGIQLGLGKCVTWAELDKELGPLRSKTDNIGDRLTVVETRCQEQHR